MVSEQASLNPNNLYKKDLATLWEEDLNRRTQADQGAVVTEIMLPSGMPVKAHRLHLLHLLQHGNIPNALLPIVEKHIALTTQAAAEETIKNVINDFEEDSQEAEIVGSGPSRAQDKSSSKVINHPVRHVRLGRRGPRKGKMTKTVAPLHATAKLRTPTTFIDMYARTHRISSQACVCHPERSVCHPA